jgi:hypothetical protein
MDARPGAVLVEGLRLAQADSLADQREVVASGAVGRTVAILEQEERRSASTEDTVAFRPIDPEPFSCTGRYRNKATFFTIALYSPAVDAPNVERQSRDTEARRVMSCGVTSARLAQHWSHAGKQRPPV